MFSDAKDLPRIRPATPSDVVSIARLHRLVREACMPYLPDLHTPEEDVAYFFGVLCESAVLVAELRGTVVAYCAYRNGWLNHLYVHPLQQRHGIGSALLARTMEAHDALQLWVFQRNVEAIAFYERAGFNLVQTTDGSGNEERERDALYGWKR